MPIRLSGIASGLDTEAMVEELMKAQRTRLTKIDNKKIKNEWTQDKWKDLNKKIYSFYTDSLSKMRLQATYNTKKISVSNENKLTASGSASLANGTHTIAVKQLASSQYITGGYIGETDDYVGSTAKTKLTDIGYKIDDSFTFEVGDEDSDDYDEFDFTVEAGSTIQDFIDAAKEAGLNASFDSAHSRIFISSKESGTANKFEITTTNTEIGLSSLGLGSEATRVEAQDAVFKYNGAEFTESSNTVTVNGLNLTLKNVTEGYGTASEELVSLSIENDVDGVYNTVKEFVTKYNELLDEMNKAYYAESARGYDPLTDEEKEAMTDEQIEKWENKIKDSLLRSDSTLGTLITSMQNALSASLENEDGDRISLSTYGIMTSVDYTEHGKLHIYGDTTDSLYASYDNKIKASFAADPEKTVKELTQIFGNLYSTMQEKMSKTSISSALTFYNDVQLNKLAKDYSKEYSTMEDRLQDIEDKYYKQFTAMEKAMSNLQSQQNSLAGLLGTNS